MTLATHPLVTDPTQAVATTRDQMLDPRHKRLPAMPPTVAPPPPFVERRVAYRRAEDRQANEERVLLARALDILASGTSAETRLAGLLRLLARTAGARRAAVLSDGVERRAAVAVEPGEDPAAGEALAAWLDASSGRSRAERAASGRAPVSIVVDNGGSDDAGKGPEAGPDGTPVGRAGETDEHAANGPWYGLLPIPSAGNVVLGFEFERPGRAGRLAERLPPQLARHAAVALALVTEQLATERELVSLRRRDGERNHFVSTVAHELRTPLTGLRGYLELLLDGRVDDAEIERDFLERSRGIVGSMADLVGDLLELSRLESGSLRLDLEQFSVAEAIGQVASALLPIAIEREIRLRTTMPPRLRAATADRRRVEQILTNLGANALKFTPSGGIVELVGRFDGPVAVLVMRDDGPGIPVDDREMIFERFHRMAGHERITGTGLGLPIARDLARRMDGDLDVASVPASGSAFVLVLPGPTATDPDAVQETLARMLAVEEVGLEERAVLRAMAEAGRSAASRHAGGGGRMRPKLVGGGGPVVDGGRRDAGGSERPTRLRAIDGTRPPDEHD